MLPGGEAGAFRSVWRLVRTTPIEAVGIDPFAPGFSLKTAMERLRETGGPTAVLTTYPIALQLLRACREQHIAVPRALSIAAINDEPVLSEMLETPLSAIHVDMAAFGAAAGKMVLEWLAGTAPARTTLVPVSNWIDRATTGPPRGL
jgi:DNA-binding LacI/PurR family transcriptional regulator